MTGSLFGDGAALIIGGSGGIGRVVAQQFAKAGTPVAVTYRSRAAGATDTANDSLMRGVAKEEGRFGIRANMILVGIIEAGMFLQFEKDGVFDDAWKKSALRNLAIKRWGKPEEIGDAAVFLASNKAAYITGQ